MNSNYNTRFAKKDLLIPIIITYHVIILKFSEKIV